MIEGIHNPGIEEMHRILGGNDLRHELCYYDDENAREEASLQ